jgi:hypothetical protein
VADYKEIEKWLAKDFSQGTAVKAAQEKSEDTERDESFQALKNLGIELKGPVYLQRRARGENTQAYKDGQFGVCFAISLSWINLKFNNSKAISSARIKTLSESTEESVKLFSKIQNAPRAESGSGKPHQLQVLTENFTLVSTFLPTISGATLVVDNDAWDPPTVTQKILQNIHAKNACLLCYNYHASSSGHAIALYRSSGKVMGIGQHYYIFEPNCGEYKVKVGELQTFLTAYSEAVKSAMKEKIGATYIATVAKK